MRFGRLILFGLMLGSVYGAGSEILDFPETVNLGELTPGKKVTTTVTGRNISGKPVSIERVRTSCGCSKAEFETAPIAPKAEATLTVSYTPGGRLGERRKSMRVYVKGQTDPCLIYLTATVVAASGDGMEAEESQDASTADPAEDTQQRTQVGEAASPVPGMDQHVSEGRAGVEDLSRQVNRTIVEQDSSLRATEKLSPRGNGLLALLGLVFAPNLLLLGAGAWALRRRTR